MVAIQLFGHLVIRCGDTPLTITSQPLKELLCYLLVHRGRERSRELLASDLWGERSTTRSLKTLRQSLWQLKTLLEDVPGLTLCDRDYPQLELGPEVALDIALLDRAAQLLGHPADLSAAELSRLQEAAAVYRGDLLEDWHFEWCLIERERYRTLHLSLLDALVTRALAEREVQAGLQFAHAALKLEPARECSHRQLMELYLLKSDRTAALQQYGRCTQLLKDEYGVGPSAATVAVYQQACEEGDLGEPPLSVPGDLKGMFGQILSLLHDIKRALETPTTR